MSKKKKKEEEKGCVSGGLFERMLPNELRSRVGFDTQVQLPPQNQNEKKDEPISPNC
jgi:hypothetical protein